MVDSVELASLLRDTAPKIEGWRSQAEQLKALVEAAHVTGNISDSLLVTVEETAAAITAEISTQSDVVVAVAKDSPAAAAELGPVSDALHLVLMEITELGTALYAVRSQQPFEAEALIAPPIDKVS